MADRLMSVEFDIARTLAAFEKLGPAAKALCESASYQTALAVKADAQARMAKRPADISDYTYLNVVIQRRNVGGHVVMTGDRVSAKESARRQSLGMKNWRKAYKAEKHVGLWLEFGTRRMRPRPWLFPAAAAQESAHFQRIASAVERAANEADL